MRLATIISLGASTALGVGALVVARLWMPGHAANAHQPAPTAAEAVPVVVAAQPIPYGVKMDARYLTIARLPPSAVPPGAYGSVSQILSQQGGPPTAIVPMAPQEPVLPSKLTGVGERGTLAALIGEGKRAFAIAVNEVSGTGGHVMPGDHVDVLLTRELPSPPNGNTQGRWMVTSVVAQDLRVLAIDQNANPTTTAPTVARSATLEVSIDDAERLALAAQSGTLSLALRKTGSVEIEPPHAVRVADFGGGSAPSAPSPSDTGATPAKPHVRLAAARPADNSPSVVIINGDVPARAHVPADGAAAGML